MPGWVTGSEKVEILLKWEGGSSAQLGFLRQQLCRGVTQLQSAPPVLKQELQQDTRSANAAPPEPKACPAGALTCTRQAWKLLAFLSMATLASFLIPSAEA